MFSVCLFVCLFVTGTTGKLVKKKKPVLRREEWCYCNDRHLGENLKDHGRMTRWHSSRGILHAVPKSVHVLG